MKYLLAIIIACLLVGCSTLPPATRVVKVENTTYVPVPSTLTEPVEIHGQLPRHPGSKMPNWVRTNGDLLQWARESNNAAWLANKKLQAIKSLVESH